MMTFGLPISCVSLILCWKLFGFLGPFLLFQSAYSTTYTCGTENVRCVEPGVFYDTINLAYDACSLDPAPCIIKVKGGIYEEENLVIDTFGYIDNFTPGQIMPYDGETVYWRSKETGFGFIRFRNNGNYWWLHGGSGKFVIQYTKYDKIIYIEDVTIGGIHIGPGIELSTASNIDAAIAIERGWNSDRYWDGIIIEGIDVLTGGSFDHVIVVNGGSIDDPSLFGTPYRLVIRDIAIVDSCVYACIRIKSLHHFLMDSITMFTYGYVDEFIELFSCHNGIVQNVMIENIVDDWRFAIELERSSNITIRHNTFVCQRVPTYNVIRLLGNSDAEEDPDFIMISANLFSGQCSSNLVGQEIVGQLDCDPSKCLGSPNSVMSCNRADADGKFMETPSLWTDNNDACSAGGMFRSIPFTRIAPRPFPYYALSDTVVDDFTPFDGACGDDIYGEPRRQSPGPTLGAREFVPPMCNGLYADNSEVCSRNGTCSGFNQCDCFNPDEYAGDWCESVVCNGEVGGLECGNGNGTCVDVDKCVCFDETKYTGPWCDIPFCNGSMSGSGSECSQRGTCVAYNECECDRGEYTGQWCEIPLCDGFAAGSGEECNGNGTCLAHNDCDCFNDLEYTGEFCSVPFCNGHMQGSGFECNNQKGVCVALDHCVCLNDQEYTGRWCDVPVCEGEIAGSPLECNYKNGTCDDFNFCTCFDETRYIGTNCDIPVCFEIPRGNGMECNQAGECIAPDHCVCPEYSDPRCENPICNDIPKGSPGECKNRGNCIAPNDCLCTEPSLFSGSDCEIWKCNEVEYSSFGEVCSGNGDCYANHSCVCTDPLFFGSNCDETKCGQYGTNDPSVCFGHGTCTVPGVCECDDSWRGAECEIPLCFGIDWNHSDVCNGRGKCQIDTHSCVCDDPELWGGSECDVMRCNGVDWDLGGVCNAVGDCIDHDCVCDNPELWGGSNCNVVRCFGIPWTDLSVCNGKGICVDHSCVCDDPKKRLGQNCEVVLCDSVRQSDSTVCSQHGECNDDSFCTCSGGFTGENCDISPIEPVADSPFADPYYVQNFMIGGGVSVLVLFVGVFGALAVLAVVIIVVCCRKKPPDQRNLPGIIGNELNKADYQEWNKDKPRSLVRRWKPTFEAAVPIAPTHGTTSNSSSSDDYYVEEEVIYEESGLKEGSPLSHGVVQALSLRGRSLRRIQNIPPPPDLDPPARPDMQTVEFNVLGD